MELFKHIGFIMTTNDLNPEELKTGDLVRHISDKVSIWAVTFVTTQPIPLPAHIHEGNYVSVTCTRTDPKCKQEVLSDMAINWKKI